MKQKYFYHEHLADYADGIRIRKHATVHFSPMLLGPMSDLKTMKGRFVSTALGTSISGVIDPLKICG